MGGFDVNHARATLLSLGAVNINGTPANTQVATWFDLDTIEGDALFTWSGTVLNVGDGTSDVNITGQETNTVDWIVGGAGAASRFQIGTIAGSARNVRLIRGGTAIVEVTNAGLSMQSGMDLTWLSEDGDIGASSTTFRPRHVYIRNNTIIGDDQTSAYGIALGDNIQGHSPLQFLGQFIGDGAQNYTAAIAMAGNLTSANADTILAGAYFDNNLTTQGNTEVVTDVAQLWLDEPSITVGAGDTITNAATLLINAAPTEGSNNYALFVRAGNTNLGPGTLDVDGAVTLSSTLTLDAASGDISFSNAEQQILFQGCTTYFISNMDTPDEMMFGQSTVSVANTTFAVENGPAFRLRNRAANEQYMDITQVSTTVLTPSGSTATASGLIPAGSFVVGITARVITAITGPTGFDIGDGTDVDRWGNSIAVALNTTADIIDYTSSTLQLFPSGSDVVLTSDGVDFTGGEVRLTVHYMTLQAPSS